MSNYPGACSLLNAQSFITLIIVTIIKYENKDVISDVV